MLKTTVSKLENSTNVTLYVRESNRLFDRHCFGGKSGISVSYDRETFISSKSYIDPRVFQGLMKRIVANLQIRCQEKGLKTSFAKKVFKNGITKPIEKDFQKQNAF